MIKIFKTSHQNWMVRYLAYSAIACLGFLYHLNGGVLDNLSTDIQSQPAAVIKTGVDLAGVSNNPNSPVARIIVDEPSWYTDQEVNLCDGTESHCYIPDLGLDMTHGYAPFAVFLQGNQSIPQDEIISWYWDFGPGTENDPHGRYFNGFNAAHVFETPGTYTVTLTVTDHTGQTSEDTQTVFVKEPDGAEYYIDSQIGDDTCDGTSSVVVDDSVCPWKTADKVFEQIQRPRGWAPLSEWSFKPGDKIMFKRGQVFDVSKTIQLNHGGTFGYHITAFGNENDPKPLIQYTGNSGDGHLIKFGLGYGHITFSELQFNFLSDTHQSAGLFAANQAVKNILFLRNDFFDHTNGAVSVSGKPSDRTVSSIFLVDNTFQQPATHVTAVTHIAGFGIHGYTLLGNHFDKSGNHIAYLGPIKNSVIAFNMFNRPAFGRTALRITSGHDIYIADNKFLGWIDSVNCFDGSSECVAPRGSLPHGEGERYNYQLLGFGRDGSTERILFERNIVTNFEKGLDLKNAEDITIRNNIFATPSEFASSFIELDVNGVHRPLEDIRIVGNTFVANGTKSKNLKNRHFIAVHPWANGVTSWGSAHQNLLLANNIFYASPKMDIPFLELYSTDPNFLNEITSENNQIYIPAVKQEKVIVTDTDTYTLDEWQIFASKDLKSTTSIPQFADSVSTVSHTSGYPGAVGGIEEASQYSIDLLPQGSAGVIKGELLYTDSYFDYKGKARYTADGEVYVGALELGASDGLLALNNTFLSLPALAPKVPPPTPTFTKGEVVTVSATDIHKTPAGVVAESLGKSFPAKIKKAGETIDDTIWYEIILPKGLRGYVPESALATASKPKKELRIGESNLKYKDATDIDNNGIDDEVEGKISALLYSKKGSVEKFNALRMAKENSKITRFENKSERDIKDDPNHTYPVGLYDFSAEVDPGDTETVTIYLDDVYQTDSWIYRKYTEDETYVDISDQVTYGTTDIDGDTVTTVTYNITDNGPLDTDTRLGYIADPAGPATEDEVAEEEVPEEEPEEEEAPEEVPEEEPEEPVTEEPTQESESSTGRRVSTSQTIQQSSIPSTFSFSNNISFVAIAFNNVQDVRYLQTFLNEFESEALPVTGIYSDADNEAVKRFQRKYKREILDVWDLSDATGYVGITTRLKMNFLLKGQTAQCPVFTEYNGGVSGVMSSNEIGKTQEILRNLDMYTGSINNTWDTVTNKSLITFQETFREVMLDPWNITEGTGYKYKTTNKFLNYFAGCDTGAVYLEGVGEYEGI